MTDSLQLTVSEHDPVLLVDAQGAIDADARLGEALALYEHRPILLFARAVTSVTEVGRRLFVDWVRGLEQLGNSLHLAECSPAFIAALDCADELLGARGSVVSLLTPYRCQGCARPQLDLVRPSTLAAGALPPPAICQLCGLPLQFDRDPREYFRFLSSLGVRPSPPSVLQAVARIDELRLTSRLGLLKELSSSRAPTLPLGTPRVPGSRPAGE